MIAELPVRSVVGRLTDCEWRTTATTTTMTAHAFLSTEASRHRMLKYGFPGGEIIVKLPGNPPSWMVPTIEGLGALLTLPSNWDTYGAPRIDPESTIAAMRLAWETFPENTPPPSVVPTSRGGLQFEWHTKDVDLEVEFLSPSRLHLFCEDLRTDQTWESEVNRDLKPLTDALAVLTRPL